MAATVAFTDLERIAKTGFPPVSELAAQQLNLESEISSEHCFEGIIGKSPAIQRVLEQVAIVAPTDSTVLLHGETGTGKELVARAIHNLSSRRDRSFVRMNCAAIPSGLLESELFGHERGAFTGALMQKQEVNNSIFDSKSLESGVYVTQIALSNGKTINKKIKFAL